jgi:hypothetical protein
MNVTPPDAVLVSLAVWVVKATLSWQQLAW